MRCGIAAFDMGFSSLLDLAVRADRLGFETLWLGQHIVWPAGYQSTHPTRESEAEHSKPAVTASTHLLDPWVAVGLLAGRTNNLRLATGVHILPIWHPLHAARAAVTAAEVSASRFTLGLGAGWLREEFEALDATFDGRGQRFEEGLEIIRGALRGGLFAYEGRHYRFDSLQVTDTEVDVPIIVGGNSDRALRRAVRFGDGWFASGSTTTGATENLRLRERLSKLLPASRSTSFRMYFRTDLQNLDELDMLQREGVQDVVLRIDRATVAQPDFDEFLPHVASRLGLVQ